MLPVRATFSTAGPVRVDAGFRRKGIERPRLWRGGRTGGGEPRTRRTIARPAPTRGSWIRGRETRVAVPPRGRGRRDENEGRPLAPEAPAGEATRPFHASPGTAKRVVP